MKTYSVNITLNSDDDKELIDFFKTYNGKKVDAVRCLAEGYFKSKTSFNSEQKQEVRDIVKDILSAVSFNINANEININSNNINEKNITSKYNYEDDELDKIINNCGIDIDF